jgi:predicted phosphoribosyltransferase
MKTLFQNREETGYLLSKALAEYKNSNAVVVGIPHGGVCVASVIADILSLPLEIMPCRKIKDPADSERTIGSVSVNDVFIHDNGHAIPQDYISHQIVILRNSISNELKRYYGSATRQSFQYLTVIVVDDILSSSDTVMACLRSIKKQSPLKIVVAVPIVAAEAARIVSAEADDFKFIKMEPTLHSPNKYFSEFSKIDETKVKTLFETSRKKSKVYG